MSKINNHLIEIHDIQKIIKQKFSNCLLSSQFCCLCLDNDNQLCSIEMEIRVDNNNQLWSSTSTLENIISYVFRNEIFHLSSKYICKQCSEKIENFYHFTQTTKELSIKMEEYCNKLDSAIVELKSQDLSQNTNIVIVIADDVKQEPAIKSEETEDIEISEYIPITYLCTKCQCSFNMQEEWESHKEIYHKNFIPQCPLCNIIFESKPLLFEHVKECAIVNCQFCHEYIPKEAMNKHLKNNHRDKMFPCNCCNLISFSIESLKSHFEVCPFAQNEKCFMCLKKLNDKEGLKGHKCKYGCSQCLEFPCLHYRYLVCYREQSLNGNKNRINCLDCDYTATSKEQLVGHANREHLNYHPYMCTDCGQQFYGREVYTYHVKRFHMDSISCQFCDKKFLNETYFKRHVEVCETDKREYQCVDCVASFDTQEKLTSHLKLKHSNKIYPCDLCKAKFVADVRLKEHKAKVHNGVQPTVKNRNSQCGTCFEKFTCISDYNKHVKMHGSNMKHICAICKKEFASLQKLQWHRVNHRRDRTERIKCNVCDKEVFVASLKLHMLYHFPRPYICENCGKSFPTEGSLKLHVRVHELHNPCPKCQMPVKPHRMRRHLKEYCTGKPKARVIGARPKRHNRKYVCKCCDYKSGNKYFIEAHYNKVHLNATPDVCKVCNKVFYSENLYNSHVMKHLKNKEDKLLHKNITQYTCGVCERNFSKEAVLIKHLKAHENEELLECDLCEKKFVNINLLQAHKIENHML